MNAMHMQYDGMLQYYYVFASWLCVELGSVSGLIHTQI